MSSGTSTQATQSSSVNQIPQWVTQAGQQNYSFAQNVANQPLTQYQGQMVADVSPQTQQAWNLAAQSGNIGQDQFAGANAGYLNSLGQNIQGVTDPGNAGNVRASTIAGSNLSPYLNPYTQNVIDTTMPIYQQALGTQQVGNQNQASGANAFGGSRMGVQQGVTQAQGAQGMAQMAQQLNQANYQQAQTAAGTDAATRNQVAETNQANQQTNLNRNLAAQTTNQGAAQAKINSDILASQGMTNLGTAMGQQNAANYTMLSQAGAGEQSQAQDQINAQMAKFQQANSYPQQQLATLLSALGMTPHDTASTGTSDQQTTTPTNWGALALGGLQDLSGFFKASDETMKTDITKLGKDPKTGLTMHAFRYKGDPKSYPKVVGPMAQEAQKKYPDKVKKQGGKLTVDPSIMAASGVQGFAEGTSDVELKTPYYPGHPLYPGPFKQQPVTYDEHGNPEFPPAIEPEVKHYADGSANVQPNWDDVPDDTFDGAGAASPMDNIGKILGGGHMAKAMGGQTPASPQTPNIPQGWGAPSQGFLVSGFADGTANVQQPDMRQIDPSYFQRGKVPDDLAGIADPTPSGMAGIRALIDRGYAYPKHYAGGINKVPKGPTVPGALAMGSDKVPALLTPGEAVLNQRAATMLGRGKIAQLNMGTPPSSPLVAAGIKAMGPRTLASFMPPKKAFGAATTAIRGGSKATGGMSNTKIRGALA